jgi:hypothetical protein
MRSGGRAGCSAAAGPGTGAGGGHRGARGTAQWRRRRPAVVAGGAGATTADGWGDARAARVGVGGGEEKEATTVARVRVGESDR